MKTLGLSPEDRHSVAIYAQSSRIQYVAGGILQTAFEALRLTMKSPAQCRALCFLTPSILACGAKLKCHFAKKYIRFRWRGLQAIKAVWGLDRISPHPFAFPLERDRARMGHPKMKVRVLEL